MQVADMTTFMAKLLFKLTEMSCNLANDQIYSINASALSERQEKAKNLNGLLVEDNKPFNSLLKQEYPCIPQ